MKKWLLVLSMSLLGSHAITVSASNSTGILVEGVPTEDTAEIEEQPVEDLQIKPETFAKEWTLTAAEKADIEAAVDISLEDKIEGLSVTLQEKVASLEQLESLIKETEASIAFMQAKMNTAKEQLRLQQNALDAEMDTYTQLLQTYQKEKSTLSQVLDSLIEGDSFVRTIEKTVTYNELMESVRKQMYVLQEKKLALQSEKRAIAIDQKIIEHKQKQLVQDKKRAEQERIELTLELTILEEKEQYRLYYQAVLEEQRRIAEALRLEEERQRQLEEELAKQMALKAEADAETVRRIQEQITQKVSTDATSTISHELVEKIKMNLDPTLEGEDLTEEISRLLEEHQAFIVPAKGKYSSAYGWRDLGEGPEFHYGIDIAAVEGTPIVAARAGEVIYSGVMGTYGNLIKIKHEWNGQTYTTVYAHLSAIGVKVGQQVRQGELIGLIGQTGRSYGSHLHFEVQLGTGHYNQAPLSPLLYLDKDIQVGEYFK